MWPRVLGVPACLHLAPQPHLAAASHPTGSGSRAATRPTAAHIRRPALPHLLLQVVVCHAVADLEKHVVVAQPVALDIVVVGQLQRKGRVLRQPEWQQVGAKRVRWSWGGPCRPAQVSSCLPAALLTEHRHASMPKGRLFPLLGSSPRCHIPSSSCSTCRCTARCRRPCSLP